MLKAPPLIPRTYISRSYIIDPTEGRQYVPKYVRKSFKQEEGRQWSMPDEKRLTMMVYAQ